MKYAIEILEAQLEEINKPIPEDAEYEEEDLIGAVLHNKQTTDIKLALKILNQFVENSKTHNIIKN